jgi:hypothetical protein
MDYSALLADIRQHPGMYLRGETYDELIAFLLGCDAGNDWGLLAGFREWLIVKIDAPTNLAWSAMVLHHVRADDRGLKQEENRRAVSTLLSLVTEFLQVRGERDGLVRVFASYFERMKTTD